MSNVMLDRLRPAVIEMFAEHPLAEMPEVDIIIATKRPELKEQYVQNINQQTVNVGKVVVSPEGYSPEDIQYLHEHIRFPVTVVELTEPKPSLGERHNQMTLATTADYVAIMDDDDIYLPDYLHGQLAYLAKTSTKLAAKANVVCKHLGMNKIGFLLPTFVFVDNSRGMGGSIVFHKDVYIAAGGFRDMVSGYDAAFLRDAYFHGYSFGSGDPFNYIVVRGVVGGHTWNIEDKKLGDVRFNTIRIEEVGQGVNNV